MKMQKNSSKTSYTEYFASIKNKLISRESLVKRTPKLKITCLEWIDRWLIKEYLYSPEDLHFRLVLINLKLHSSQREELKVNKLIALHQLAQIVKQIQKNLWIISRSV
jgi:hypothetical protein